MARPARKAEEDWRYEVANGDTKLGLKEWMEHQAEMTGEVPIKRFRVEGQVYLADGFEITVEASSRDEAERKAREWAEDDKRDWEPDINEVCIQSVVEEEG